MLLPKVTPSAPSTRALKVSRGNFDINTMDHMKMFKNSAFVGNRLAQRAWKA